MDGRIQGGLLLIALEEAGLSPGELWIEYSALGGGATEFELEAYLGTAIVLPAFERDLLADACNCLLKQAAVAMRIPQSRDDEPDAADEDPWTVAGAAGVFLLPSDRPGTEHLDALGPTGLFDTAPEARFDRFTRQAVEEFGAGTAFIVLVDHRRMSLKSVAGPIEQDLSRSIAFCTETLGSDGPLIVPDTLLDERFRGSPPVTGEPRIRFCAGHPLRGPGHRVAGAICVVDQHPRTSTHEDRRVLRRLAVGVEAELAGRP